MLLPRGLRTEEKGAPSSFLPFLRSARALRKSYTERVTVVLMQFSKVATKEEEEKRGTEIGRRRRLTHCRPVWEGGGGRFERQLQQGDSNKNTQTARFGTPVRVYGLQGAEK